MRFRWLMVVVVVVVLLLLMVLAWGEAVEGKTDDFFGDS